MKKLILITVYALMASYVNAQWLQMYGPYGASVRSIAIKGTNIFAGTYGGGIFLSINNDTNWTNVNNGLTNTFVTSLVVSGPNIFAGTYGGGIFLSSDNGASWTSRNNGLTSTDVNTITIDGTKIFAGTSGGGVFLSTNNGDNWSYVGLNGNDVRTIAITGSIIIAGTYNFIIYLSTNNGTTWIDYAGAIAFIRTTSIAIGGYNVYAGTDGIGVSRNTLNDWDWQGFDTGLTTDHINVLAISGKKIVAATTAGVFISDTNVANWISCNYGLSDTTVNSLVISDSNIYIGTKDSGVWKCPISQIIGIKNIIDDHYDIIVYPNPTSDNLTIETPQKASIEIINIQGQIIKTLKTTEDKTQVDVSALAGGVYIIKLNTGEGSVVRKFVKQ